MTRIAVPVVHVADCRHIDITKDKGVGSVVIDIDAGVLVISITGNPVVEITEGDSQEGGDDAR